MRRCEDTWDVPDIQEHALDNSAHLDIEIAVKCGRPAQTTPSAQESLKQSNAVALTEHQDGLRV
jgi:hypothetical protein